MVGRPRREGAVLVISWPSTTPPLDDVPVLAMRARLAGWSIEVVLGWETRCRGVEGAHWRELWAFRLNKNYGSLGRHGL